MGCLNCFLPHFLKQEFLTEFGVYQMSNQAGWPVSSRDPSLSIYSVQGLQMCATMTSLFVCFYVGDRNPNSDPQVCKASTLLTKLQSKPSFSFITVITILSELTDNIPKKN